MMRLAGKLALPLAIALALGGMPSLAQETAPDPGAEGQQNAPEAGDAAAGEGAPDELAAVDPTQAVGAGRDIVIGAGNVAGVYFPAAGAICRVVSERPGGSRCLVETNANSAANLERLRDGLLDFAIVQSDWLMHASRGTNLFRPNGPDETLRAVFSLHSEPLTLIARADAGIRSAADLEGKRLNLGPAFTYQRVLTDALLRALKIDDDLALTVELPPDEQFSALCAGEIDAATLVVAHPSPEIANAMLRCDLRLVPVEGKAVDSLLKARPELSHAVIQGGLYAGAPDPVPSFGLRAVLATTSQVEDEIVRGVAEAVLTALPEFRAQHPVLAPLSAESMVSEGIAIPLHDAAKDYFRTANLLP